MTETRTRAAGLVFNLQRFSTHDGPGIRTTVFLKGCPLRCAWCHNPESMRPIPELLVRPSRCIRCGCCVAACTEEAAAIPDGTAPPVDGACTTCGACVEACPVGGREIVGQRVSPDELMDEVLRDRVFFEESGGGVTFSGGEPLSQPEFLIRCLEISRAHGLHTAVDTCGHAPLERVLAVVDLADLVLFDMKVIDDRRHRRYTGVGNARILENLHEISERHDAVWLRVPVIPGFNDDESNLEAVARLARSLRGVRRICLLPYHATGVSKYGQIGDHVIPDELGAPSAERMATLALRFREAGLETTIGG